MFFYLGGAALLTIGIIVAFSIKHDQSDKVKGDKRLVTAIFILTSFTCFLSGFILSRCKEGIRSSIFDTTGIYVQDAAKAKAAGVKLDSFNF